MSLYRTLIAELPCGHCGMAREVAVQFRTGTDNFEEYRADESLAEEAYLIPGVDYAGVADYYCRTCLIQRKTVELSAFYDSLAELIAEERLLLRQGLLFKRPVAPLELARIRNQHVAVWTRKPDPKSSIFETLSRRDVFWEGRRARPGSFEYINFIEVMNTRLAEKLKILGWTRRTLLRDDIVVRLGDQNKIRFECPSECPESLEQQGTLEEECV